MNWNLVMSRYLASIALAAAILIIAAAAAVGLVSQGIAQIASFALLAMFPGAWLNRHRACVSRGSAP